MSLNRYAKRRDDNEAEIVSALRDIPGCKVELLDKPCDLLVGFQAKNILLEIKMPGRENRSDQRKQREWRETWPGQIRVVTSVDEALDCVLNSHGWYNDK